MPKLQPWHGLGLLNAIVIGVMAWTTAQSQAQLPADGIIRARLIELVDEHGEMRAQLHIAETGGGELRLRSGEGEIRVKLGATADGAILLMTDGRTEPTVRLAADRSGPSLKLMVPGKAEKIIVP